MEQNEMTPEKSLRLMTEVINKSRRDFEKNAGTPLIFWGSLVALTALVIWIAITRTGNDFWNYLWFAIPVAGGVLSPVFLKKKTKKRAKNFLNDAIGYVWLLFGAISVILALVIVFAFPNLMSFISLATVLLMGFSTALSGILLKNYPVIIIGITVAIGGVLLLGTLTTSLAYVLTIGLTAILDLIVPGVILNIRSK